MSRAMNIKASEAEVLALCVKHGASVSAIESLVTGGTRLVLSHPDEATAMRTLFGKKIIEGPVRRAPFATWER